MSNRNSNKNIPASQRQVMPIRSRSLPNKPANNNQKKFVEKINTTGDNIHTLDSLSDATEATRQTHTSGFSVIIPDNTKHQNLIRNAKREEMLWNKYNDQHKLKSVHETHLLGGKQTDYDIHKAREKFLKKVAPTEVEKRIQMQEKFIEWTLREEELDREEDRRKENGENDVLEKPSKKPETIRSNQVKTTNVVKPSATKLQPLNTNGIHFSRLSKQQQTNTKVGKPTPNSQQLNNKTKNHHKSREELSQEIRNARENFLKQVEQ